MTTDGTYIECGISLLTHPFRGLENYRQLMETLTGAKDAICEVASV